MIEEFQNFIKTEWGPYWLCLILTALSVLATWILSLLLTHILLPWLRKYRESHSSSWTEHLLSDEMMRDMRRFLVIFILSAMLPTAFSPLHGHLHWATSLILRLVAAFNVAQFVRLLTTFVSGLNKSASSDERFHESYTTGLLQFLNLIISITGIIVVIAILVNKSPLSFLAGLGAAATVLMLVFKDTILGLVAGIQLTSNKMLRVGDWITVKSAGIDGTVEQISLTTVKVRGWDNTIITIPPYQLVSAPFQNWRGMSESDGRLVTRAIYIDMKSIARLSSDDFEKLKKAGLIAEKEIFNSKCPQVNLTMFRRKAESLLRENKSVNTSATLMLRQLKPTPEGLPVEMYFYSREKEFVSFEHLAAETVERLVALLPEFGLKPFQFCVNGDTDILVSKQ